MMMQGWFKFYSKTLENPIIMKDADHLAVWTYLLMKASHKPFDIVFAGERMTVETGQVVTGRKQISCDLKMNENKVYRVLNSFKSEQQIEQRTDRKKSVITILNWDKYQKSEQRNEQRVNNDRTTSEQRVNTKIIEYKNNKNDNNISNSIDYDNSLLYTSKEKEIDKSISKKKSDRNIIPPTVEMVKAYCDGRNNGIDPQTFVDFYESKGWFIGKSKMKNWQAAVRTWENKDKPKDKPKEKGWLDE